MSLSVISLCLALSVAHAAPGAIEPRSEAAGHKTTPTLPPLKSLLGPLTGLAPFVSGWLPAGSDPATTSVPTAVSAAVSAAAPSSPEPAPAAVTKAAPATSLPQEVFSIYSSTYFTSTVSGTPVLIGVFSPTASAEAFTVTEPVLAAGAAPAVDTPLLVSAPAAGQPTGAAAAASVNPLLQSAVQGIGDGIARDVESAILKNLMTVLPIPA